MKPIVIDVREPEEFQVSHVEGAINIPPADLMTLSDETLKAIPRDAKIIVYCRTGSRSNVAINILQQHGYVNLINGINQEQVEARYL